MPRKVKKIKSAKSKPKLKSKLSSRKIRISSSSSKKPDSTSPKFSGLTKTKSHRQPSESIRKADSFAILTLQKDGSSKQGLPFSYNVTALVLMPRDPYWVFCYWDFSGETWNLIQRIYERAPGHIRAVLRVYDVTDIKFNGLNSHRFFDMDVSLEVKNWYVHVNGANREWIFDLAIIDSNGKFHLIVRSNRIRTPRDTPSDIIDEEWMILDFDEIYALSGGFGKGLSSGELRELINSRYLTQRMIFSSHAHAAPK